MDDWRRFREACLTLGRAVWADRASLALFVLIVWVLFVVCTLAVMGGVLG